MAPHYAQLGYHVFNICNVFLEHEVQSLPLKEGAYSRVAALGEDTQAKTLAYGRDVLERFRAWWVGPGPATDFSRKANVYTAT